MKDDQNLLHGIISQLQIYVHPKACSNQTGQFIGNVSL